MSKLIFPKFLRKDGGSDNLIRQPKFIYDFIFDYNDLSNVSLIDYPDKFIDYSNSLALEIVTSSVEIQDKIYRIALQINEFDYRVFPIKSFEEILTDLIFEWYVDGVLEQTNSTNKESFELKPEYIGKSIQTKIVNTQTNEENLSNIISVDYILNISLNNVINLNFQNGDKVSRYGLNQSEADTIYGGTNLDGIEIINNGVQRYKIPETTGYRFECFGAKGGGNYGGKGAYMSGIFRLNEGDYIQVGCGNQGTWDQNEASGGGASWVAKELSDGSLDLLLIAGGGGGSANNQADSSGGSISINGNQSVTNSNNHPGVNGSGGEDYNSNAHNGSGWYFGGNYHSAIKDDPRGSERELDGGFGGGGACRRYYNYVSGGGGYSGGEGGRYGSQIGGGGGSFNKGNFQENIPNYNDGHGKVNCEYYSSTIDDYFDIISPPQISKQIIGDALFLVTDFEFKYFKLLNLQIQDLDVSYKWFKDGTEITTIGLYIYELDLTNDIDSDFYVEITNNKTGNVYTTNTLTTDSSDSDFDIAKLEEVNLYLDANNDNSLTVDGSNNVSGWTDLVSGNIAEQFDTGLQPLKQIDSWNTHNTVYFSNDQQLIINPNFQSQNNYWFFLIKLETTHSQIAIAGSNSDYFTVAQDGSSHDRFLYFKYEGSDIAPPKRTNFRFTGNDISISNRGELYTQITPVEGLVCEIQHLPEMDRNLSLGSSSRGTSWYANGEFQAIVCINGDCRDVDYIANQIVGLLAHRVGIDTNLPTDHPYKANPPSLTNGQVDSITIVQNTLVIAIDALTYHIAPIESPETLIRKGYISTKWFLEGVEVEKDTTLFDLDLNNGDLGKDIYLEIHDFAKNLITSNTLSITQFFLIPKALNFASSDILNVPVSAYPSGNEITIEFWFYGTSSSYNAEANFLKVHNLNNHRELNLHLPWDNGRVYWDCGASGGSNYDRISTNISLSQYTGWNHWAFTKNANTGVMSIILNGVIIESEGNKTRSIQSFNISSNIGAGMEDFKLSNMRIWNYARSEREINDHKAVVLVNESGLISSWGFISGVGNQLLDLTENKNNGTISGATWESAGYFTPLQFNSVEIIQEGFIVVINPDTSDYTASPSRTFQQMINMNEMSVKWIVDGTEVSEENKDSLSLDTNNGDLGKTITLEITDINNNNIILSNTITVDYYFWSPKRFTNLALWLDASDESTITKDVDNRVSQWNDKSSQQNNAYNNSSDKPTANNNRLYFTNYESLTIDQFGLNYYNWFFVFKDNASTHLAIAGSANNSYLTIAKNSTTLNIIRINGEDNPTGYSFLFNGEVSQSVNNRGELYNAMTTQEKEILLIKNIPIMTDSISIGRSDSNTNWSIDGDLYEIINLDETMTFEQQQKTEGYLAHKWGLTDKLPSDHPYKTTVP